MEIKKLKNKSSNENDGILKVAAYIRVSSELDQAQKSFDNQYKHYKRIIPTHDGWSFAGIYSDNGITGTSTLKRNGFLKMLVDAEFGKFDLIITKSISRFARNTLDTIKYVRYLKNRGIGIYFEEEKINTLNMSSELVLSILSSVAQQEVLNLRESITYGLKQQMAEGKLTGFTGCLGYDYNPETQELTIIKEEAKIVRKIFEMYANGYGVEKIKQYLNDNNIPTKTGNKYWRGSVIMKILRNEKYSGDLMLGRWCTVDNGDIRKNILNRGQSDKYYVKNNHKRIIEKELFEKVQKMIDSNFDSFQIKATLGNKALNRYCFSHHLRCGFCGGPMQRNVPSKYSEPNYRCVVNEKVQKGLCNESKTVHVSFLENIFVEAINKYKKSSLKPDNMLIKSKLNYINSLIRERVIKSFDEELFIDLVHAIIFGRKIEEKIETHSIRIILRTNKFIKRSPTKETVLNHHFYKILEYKTEFETNWREYRTNLLHVVRDTYVSIELDMDSDV